MPQGHDTSSSEDRPNVVVVLADDMGFSDIGCYGGEINTPYLDQLAGNGTRFTQAYNYARCCPTRASLLTGLHPHKAGMGWMTGTELGPDGYVGDLNDRCVTIAEVLGEAGYATYMSGKWHLTRDEFQRPDASKHNWPLQRGFDRFYGTLAGAGSYYTPDTLTRGNDRIEPPDDFYYTDAISDTAAEFVRDHDEANSPSPFFLYVAYTAPHWPLHAKEDDIATYEDIYREGWDAIRERRYDELVNQGIINADWDLAPRDGKPWDEIAAEQKDELARKMAIYAAQIDTMDRGIGQVIAALKDTEQFEDTLVLFLSDNGGCAEGGPFGFDQMAHTDDRVLGEDSSFASYGRYWANVSNTPFRLYKHWVHEGGIATPLIAHWPNQIEANGALVTDPAHVIDVMATCLDVADTEYPASHDGNEIAPLDGTSLMPVFNGDPLDREALFWEHEGNRAVRQDNWKLVAKGTNAAWELYDMEADRTELHDLAEDHPERVADLRERWEAYADRANVYPLDGRSWEERIQECTEHLDL